MKQNTSQSSPVRGGKAPASFDRFRQQAAAAVVLPAAEALVESSFLDGGQGPPRVYSPRLDDVDLGAWAGEHRERLDAELLEHGAILFRGFEVRSAADFEGFAESLCPELFGEYEDLPHEKDGRNIYRSTPYPADKTILFHNESSHLHRWPRKQWFCCLQPSRQRGETPIVDCREMYRRLDPEIRDAFEARGLLYVRNFVEGFDVSWQEFFATDERATVEDYCRRAGFDCEWPQGDRLRIRRRSAAVVRHPASGEKSFFNQVQLHHAACLEPDARRSLLDTFGEEGLPRHVYFGDGSPIPDAVMERVSELYWQLAVQFPWQRGDVLMLDNMIMAHARNPYVGERKILVAMGEIVTPADLA